MSFDMVNTEKRFVPEERERLGRGRADEEGRDEARTLGDGNEVDITWCEFGGSERGFDDGDDISGMFTGGEIGDDATIRRVEGDL